MLIKYVLNISKLPKYYLHKRHLWHWINVTFNRVDEERLKLFGPDRVCAEWILRNGGRVKFVGVKEYLGDYNLLPTEGTLVHIQEIDASSSSIMDVGFAHLVGCNHIRKVILHNCGYLQDSALPLLRPINKTLRCLQVSSCNNISDVGLKQLGQLTNLIDLLIFDLTYVKNPEQIVQGLKRALPKCNITYK